MADAKERLIRAGEHLFARNGVDGTRVRELNALAEQRNSSALHYHFGSRAGLLRAIVEQHSGRIDAQRAERLSSYQGRETLNDLVTVILAPLADELSSSSGRDYLRIVPLTVDGPIVPPVLMEVFLRAEACLSELVPTLRRERLSSMFLAASTLLAARATRIEDGRDIALGHGRFVGNLIDMMTAMVAAPDTATSK